MPVNAETYERVALKDPDGKWELIDGRLHQKPGMTTEHEQIARKLVRRLVLQLREEEFTVGQDSPKLRIPSGNYRIPDVCVVPTPLVQARLRRRLQGLETYEEPMPLVVEVWSPSTGAHDVDEKLREYQQRGDLEIWRIHPYERTLTAWRRQSDGSYTETLYTGGAVRPASLSSVVIDLDELLG